MSNNIIVLAERTIFYHEPMSCWVARIRGLGLTVYADTEDEATEKIEVFLDFAIRHMYERGILEKWLTKSGVEWTVEGVSSKENSR